MTHSRQALIDLKPTKEFFIGIDSDGSVFDTMETKHKECFIPMLIKHLNLQAVSKYARETWDFVSLYSKTRGLNRFPALVRTLDLLRERPEVKARHAQIPDSAPLAAWIAKGKALTNSTLETEVKSGNTALQPVLAWSVAVNKMIEDMVYGVPPFPYFRDSLQLMAARADVVIVSQTPTDALQREWSEHAIAQYVMAIAGQELGSKTDHIRWAAGGKYAPGKMLMIGDAPGDYQAAKANGAFFYPIVPGQEEESWKRFRDESLSYFLSGKYNDEYEAKLRREYEAHLPELPRWMAAGAGMGAKS
jgi:phosphoglycolate phosphatase-like HAD superfamily hydrolase